MTRQAARAAAFALIENVEKGLLDRLYADPTAHTTCGDYILVRGVSAEDRESYIDLSGMKLPDARESILFEIVGLGDAVPAKFKDAVGDYCVSLSTCINPVAGMHRSAYALVHHDTVASVLRAESIVELVALITAEKAELAKGANKRGKIDLGFSANV